MLGLARTEPSSRLSIVRLTIAALNLCVGALFLLRGPVLLRASASALARSIPSLVMTGIALKLAPPPSQWPLWAALVFAAGGAFAVTSLATLGRCFALLPAVRGVVTAGPFRLVRHPAYAGELSMIAACCAASARPLVAIVVAALTAATLVVRIRVEERLLSAIPAYEEYATRVRFRLLPWIW